MKKVVQLVHIISKLPSFPLLNFFLGGSRVLYYNDIYTVFVNLEISEINEIYTLKKFIRNFMMFFFMPVIEMMIVNI